MRYSTKKEVLDMTGVDWMANDSTIKKEMAAHQKELSSMDPVAVVQYKETRESDLIKIMEQTVSRIGGARITRNGISFAFDRKGIDDILNHAKTNEKYAAALASPYVAKYGQLIAGQKNHKSRGITTLTYAAPVVINGDTVNVGVSIHFTADGRAYAANVDTQSGVPFAINMKKAPVGTGSRVDRYSQGTALPATDAFNDKVAQSGETVKRQSLKDMTIYNRTAVLKEIAVDKYLADYAAKSSPNYAQAYIVRMSPTDFVNLTTSRAGRQIIEQQTGDLNMDELQKANVQQPIQLRIDHETGEINGHEGRHRALALARAGVQSIPVLLFDSSNKNSKAAIDGLTLTGQDFGSSRSTATVTVNDVQPLSYANRDAVVEKFTKQPGTERVAENYGRTTARYGPEAWSEQLEAYINGKIRNGENVQLIAEDGDILTLTARTAGKVASRYNNDGTTMSDEEFERKANAGAHIDELAKVSRRGTSTVQDYDGKHGESAGGGWNYRTAYFEDFDGKYYRCRISVQIGSDGNAVYNIGQMQERSRPQINGSSGNAGAQTGTASKEIKAQSGETVKRNSLKSDADYLAAVERGDMETAQRMVDEAAKNAGYNYIRYTRRKQSLRNDDADYYMFAENDGYGRDDLQSVYGQYGYYASDAGSIDVSDIIDDLREAWRGFAEANGYEFSILPYFNIFCSLIFLPHTVWICL